MIEAPLRIIASDAAALASTAFERRLTRDDVVGAYAGLRPLLDAGGGTADLSRRHAVLTSDTGVVTIVDGKLTTYRRMAEDAVDADVSQQRLAARPCATRSLPLLGAADRARLESLDAPPRLVRRYGLEAPLVLENARAGHRTRRRGAAGPDRRRPPAHGSRSWCSA